jgi:hypothetical protein
MRMDGSCERVKLTKVSAALRRLGNASLRSERAQFAFESGAVNQRASRWSFIEQRAPIPILTSRIRFLITTHDGEAAMG